MSNDLNRRTDIVLLETEYRALVSSFDRFSEEFNRQLQRLVLDSGVRLGFPIQCRVKSWESIAEKLTRLSLQIQSVKELQDLVGFRLIVVFRRDLDMVVQAIRDHLTIVSKYDTSERLREDQFGYSSLHCIVRLPSEWLALPTFSGMDGLVAELQLRTVAQHIWAEASHMLQYKRESSVPTTLRRGIYRVSALLEIVDLEFERVLADRSQYQEHAGSADVDEALNVDLLVKILDETFPKQNKAPDEEYAEALEDLLQFEIRTRDGLRSLIRERRDAAISRDHAAVEEIRKEGRDAPYSFEPERLETGVFYAHVGLLREMLRDKFGERFDEYMHKAHHRFS